MTTTLEHPLPDSSSDAPETTSRRWRVRTKVLIGVGAAVAVAGGIVLVDFAVAETTHETRSFHDQITSVDADVSSGSIRVIGSDQREVTVDMTVRSGLRSPSHTESVVNGRLLLRTGCDTAFAGNCKVDYVVHVPAATSVSAHGDGGNIDLVAMTGDADVSVNGGRVRLGFADAPDHVKVRADGGEIVVAVPDDGQAYDVNAGSSGGTSHVDIRTDPASDHVIDAHVSGGSVVVKYGN